MEKSHKAILNKANKAILLLLFVGFIITITGSAAASSSAAQSQSVQLTVTRDGVISNLDQAQIVCVENGVAKAYQISYFKVTYDKNGKVKSVILRLRQVENVISSSTDTTSTVDSINDIDSNQYQDANCVVTADGANINLNQAQITCEDSNGVIKQVELIKVKVKFLKNGQIKVVIKMKQRQIATSKINL